MYRTAPFALIATLLTGCQVHQQRVAEDPIQMPAQFGQAEPQDAQVALRVDWWVVFDDPGLNRAMAQMFTQNLSLRQSWARLEMVRAVATMSGSSRWPTVTGGLSASRSRLYAMSLPTAPGESPSMEAMHQNQYGVSVAATYEVDVWGRIDAQVKAAEQDVVAAEEDIQALAMSLAGGLAEAWFTLAEQRAQLALLKVQLQTSSTLLELVELRFAQGLSAGVDVLQQRTQRQQLKAQLPSVEGRIRSLEHQISVWVGEAPGQHEFAPKALPKLSALPKTGIPAEVLAGRPDVRAAQARLIAADQRVAAAVAQRYPAIRLTASAGFGATTLKDLVDQWVWSLAGNLVMPIFDAGRLATEVERNKAATRLQLAGVAQVMLRALQEVEDALSQEAHQRAYLVELEVQLKLSQSLLEETRYRYLEGLTTYLSVLGALNGLQLVEQRHLSARRTLVSQRIQLYRALGGDWSSTLKDPS